MPARTEDGVARILSSLDDDHAGARERAPLPLRGSVDADRRSRRALRRPFERFERLGAFIEACVVPGRVAPALAAFLVVGTALGLYVGAALAPATEPLPAPRLAVDLSSTLFDVEPPGFLPGSHLMGETRRGDGR